MSKNTNDIVITSAVRSPIGSYKGALKDLKADCIGSICIKECLNRSNLNPDEVDEVILGQVLTAGEGQNSARQAAINASIPNTKPAHIVNQVCGSGLRAIISGYQLIKLGDSEIVIAGGQENMSRSPHAIFYRAEKKLDKELLVDTMINDGLVDAFNKYHMGITAENVARKFNISRDEQDNFAFQSQQKASDAIINKKFEKEIIKINANNNKTFLSQDEYPKKNITIDDLKKLEPVFKEQGTVTAGNSSGLNDGAAVVALMSRESADKKNLQILAKIKSWANSGVDPSIMGIGPIPASKLALVKAGWEIGDIDLFELNEAFAAQTLAVIKELKLPKEKVNVNGGAIALGHPIGASGTRIVVSLIHEMEKRDIRKGLATLCIGGGMGISMCLERD
tara:strand:- start:936 stop:2117 length:1182 start_codon:yes stop_codon:yes gene_type:complete